MSPTVRYFRAGGFNQIQLETAEDLKALATLDQTLWVASSCPTKGLDMDETTLSQMDFDNDGRIRVPEILTAVNWTLRVLKVPDSLPEGRDWIDLSQLNTEDADGANILNAAKRVLRNLGRFEDTRIALADVLDRESIFAVVKSNGDGVIPVSAADGPTVAAVLQNILDTVGGATDRGGDTGVTAEGVAAFYQALQDYADWWTAGHPAAKALFTVAIEGEEPGTAALPDLDPAIFPFGDKTAAAWAAVEAIAPKVEDFFENCEVAAFDAQAVSFFNFSDRDLGKLGGRTKAEIDSMLQDLPLARVEAEAPLPLADGVNPFYASALSALEQHAVEPVFGQQKTSLTQSEWRVIRQKLAPYGAWIAGKKGAAVEKLGLERIGTLLGESQRKAIEVLIEVDKAIAAEIKAVDQVEKLLRYHRDLFRLLNNYVSLPEFYDVDCRAVFQLGKLIIDGCALNLCVEVDDINKHSLIATKSGIFLVYCEIQRVGEPAKRTIAAAVTQRNVGRITAGKNAVFYDRYGKDWDARVVKVVENPISIRQAALAPFKKIAELIGSQIDKLTSSRQKAIEASLTSSIQNADKQLGSAVPIDKPAAAAPVPEKSNSNMGGILAGGGVALAALSSSFAFIAQTFQKINDVYFLYTAILVLLFILLPAVIIGFFKLRARDIGMVLEACGWAINGKMRISLAMAKQLTEVGKFPSTSRRTFPRYAEKRGGLWRVLFWTILLTLAGVFGYRMARVLWFPGAPKDEVLTQVERTVTDVSDAVEAATK